MITFLRIIKSGFKNLFRNAWLSIAATAIMVITLVIVSVFSFSALFLQNQLAVIRDKIDLTVFLSEKASQEDVTKLQEEIKGLENVKNVTYISKADALERLRESSKDGEQLARTAEEIGNPLPASIEVKTTSLDDLATLDAKIRTLPEASAITQTSLQDNNVRKQVVENINKISQGVSRIGTIISVAFLIVSLLIIFNTIRMAIFTRREEIDIMKLVGATKWYIRGPFLVEGAVYGIIGATIAIAIAIPSLNFAKPLFVNYFSTTDVIDFVSARYNLVITGMYALGMFIGTTSSYLAISRHLKL
ncbi:ABC transporter permease [Patescibacteria group bacterium]|nr:MAG: ABC transporter permease [Patescibacteria group bacterium]